MTSLPFVTNHQYNWLRQQHPDGTDNGEDNKKYLQGLLHRKNIALNYMLQAISIINKQHQKLLQYICYPKHRQKYRVYNFIQALSHKYSKAKEEQSKTQRLDTDGSIGRLAFLSISHSTSVYLTWRHFLGGERIAEISAVHRRLRALFKLCTMKHYERIGDQCQPITTQGCEFKQVKVAADINQFFKNCT